MATQSVSSLRSKAVAHVNDMLNGGFGVVTVYDADIFEYDATNFKDKKVKDIVTTLLAEKEASSSTYLGSIDSFQSSTATTEAETSSIKGGKNYKTLIKYLRDKTCTLEISDALGSLKSWRYFTGAVGEDFESGRTEYSDDLKDGLDSAVIHYSMEGSTPKTILGKTYFIDRETGVKVDMYILFYKFTSDETMTLTMDPSSDASTFDLSGELLPETILVGPNNTTDADNKDRDLDTFYSILPVDFSI